MFSGSNSVVMFWFYEDATDAHSFNLKASQMTLEASSVTHKLGS